MRASQWLLGLATSSAIVAAVVSGCGGNSTNNPTDSGTADVTQMEAAPPKEAAAEAAPEAAAEAAACVPDAMIGTITIPDSGLGEGGSTAACLGCVLTACPNLIMECNAICGCPQAFAMFETCLAAGGSALSCGQTDLLGAGVPISDLTCALACANTCGVVLPTDGGDAGDTATPPSDGGDGG